MMEAAAAAVEDYIIESKGSLSLKYISREKKAYPSSMAPRLSLPEGKIDSYGWFGKLDNNHHIAHSFETSSKDDQHQKNTLLILYISEEQHQLQHVASWVGRYG